MLQASRYISLIQKYFPSEEWVTAIAVCQAESSGNPNASNLAASENHTWYAHRASDPKFTMGSFGLFQLGAFAADNTYNGPDGLPVYGLERLYEPETNICIAAQIFKQRGLGNRWIDWGAFTNGAYKQWLASAQNDLAAYKPAEAPTTPNKAPDITIASQSPVQPLNQPAKQGFWDNVDINYKKLDKHGVSGVKATSGVIADRYKIFDDARQVSTSSFIGTLAHQLWDKFVINIENQFEWLEYFHESADTAFEFLLLPAVIVGVFLLEKSLYRKLIKENPNPNIFVEYIFSLFSSKLYTNKKLKEDNEKLKADNLAN